MAMSSLDDVLDYVNDPNMKKCMSWLKAKKMERDGNDAAIADRITDGCDIGIKSLHKNQYKAADDAGLFVMP